MNIITDPRCAEYSTPGHPECPRRVIGAHEAIQSNLTLPITWAEPLPVEDAILLRAHTPEHLQRLEIPLDMDADTPAYPQIAAHARRSVGAALQALRLARAGQMAFSLMRPPGHHATRQTAMGFCYLNSIAIAALAARAEGCRRVAVLDFDVHHGNGTEDILLDQPGCAFISVHQSPCYPGTGLADRGANCFNFPVRPGVPRREYRAALERAFERLRQFQPDLVAVSAGFDAYRGDPLASGSLEAEDYQWLGQTVRQMQAPAFSILEGGYSDALPQLILAYLSGLIS
ncbi:MAG: histone deacetylase [Verrucomicrobiota bacterium]|jgi:acetoin utilization deacetylase AcuC-like enzyme